MRDALLASDQDQYFRILARMELLLPVSVDAIAGRVPMGWATWTTGNRTHILAFTSPTAMSLCLNDPTGTYRSVPFHTLAAEWPNEEWWLAINPGLPIEAYLPAWFISQLTRGDVRLPGRTALGSQRIRMAQSDLAAAINGRIRAMGPSRGAAGSGVANAASAAPRPTVPVGGPMAAAAPSASTGPVRPVARAAAMASVRPGPAHAAGTTEPRPGLTAPGSTAPGSTVPGSTVPGSTAPMRADATVGYPAPPGYGERLALSASAAPAEVRRGSEPITETIEAEIIDYPPSPPNGPSRTVSAAVAFSAGRAAAAAGAPPSAASTQASNRTQPSSRTRVRETYDAEIVPDEAPARFTPANETEANLYAAVNENNTDAFLSTLLLAEILVPVPPGTPTTARPRDPDFPWQIDQIDGQRYISVYTSSERMAEDPRPRSGPERATVGLRFVQLIGAWPDEGISFAVNPGTPVGATLPGSEIVALATWAADVGLREEPPAEAVAAKKLESPPAPGVAGAPAAGAEQAIVMQRTVPHAQVPFYLERGYDRVAGFVNRASEVAHLTYPRLLYKGLGLLYPGSPFSENDAEVHILRWVAHRADLYRLPYGGQHEAAMRAMQGWVIERPPFRGNGFAPGDLDVIAEFKVDSVRLPHGAQMLKLTNDGTETLVATFDADTGRWVRPRDAQQSSNPGGGDA